MELQSVFDISEWERIQDEISKLTGTAIITVDYKGIPVTKHSGRTDFCSVIRDSENTRKRCYKCDAFAGLEAVRNNKPYIYLCHCGIVDVAVPIVVNDRYLGAVMFGQVRIPNNDTNKVERLINEFSSFEDEYPNAKEDLYSKYLKLPVLKYETIVQIANTIEVIIGYIIRQRTRLQNEKKLFEYAVQSKLSFNGKYEDDVSVIALNDNTYSDRTNVPLQNTDTIPGFIPETSIVYPALIYIHNDESEFPSMKDMANLCHISQSYFSRKFLQVTGFNYNTYLMNHKIALVKKYLIEGTTPISQISNVLGFQDPSYLSKVFKKIVGITPAEFRQRFTVK